MRKRLFKIISLLSLSCILLSPSAYAFKIGDVNFDTSLGAQTRYFDNNASARIIQRRHEFATIYFQQEVSYQWNGGDNSFMFTPYFSYSRYEDPWQIEHDGYVPFIVPIPILDFGETRTADRIYGDIRELLFTKISESRKWELRYGIGKVFWGVTESQHLVDVINQDDLLVDIDGEDKLGQPMVNLTLVFNSGNLDLFVLPGFRERVYQENVGRLAPFFYLGPVTALGTGDAYQPVSLTNPATLVNREAASWESGAEALHTDFAVRWSQSIGINDYGIYVFQGTNRDPVFTGINETVALANITTSSTFPAIQYITPYYEQMTQVGLDYQATFDGLLLKFEGVYRDSDSLKTPSQDAQKGITTGFTTDYFATTFGFEYTFSQILGTRADLGFLMEYSYDDRSWEADTTNQNDLFVGFRFAKNSSADAQILAGISQDLDYDSYVAFFEANRRLGQDSKIIFEGISAYADGTGPAAAGERDATIVLQNEGHVRLAWETYF